MASTQGAAMLSGGPREPPGPGGRGQLGPDAPRPFFWGFFDKIGSCLNFLCCCRLLKNGFGGPLSPPEPPRLPDPPESPGPPRRHVGVKELAEPPYCESTPACVVADAGRYATPTPTHDSSTRGARQICYAPPRK
ncbi:uncharacterized protein LOC133852280 [Alnus glutinosa]|uniref:uncharacterized protein LOC133852280 n=1 Tax=Alnus glutinosa TaxID=3517 RepID=UPI002D78CF44|nr:uncharacterized protein LOC133852280 [Alnus glutinosa]